MANLHSRLSRAEKKKPRQEAKPGTWDREKLAAMSDEELAAEIRRVDKLHAELDAERERLGIPKSPEEIEIERQIAELEARQ